VGADSASEDSASEDFAAVAVGMSVALVVAALGDSGNAVAANTSGCDDVGAFIGAVLASEEADEAAGGAGTVESDVEGAAGIEAAVLVGETGRGPRSSVAEADNLKSANTMAHAMANFTQPPCT